MTKTDKKGKNHLDAQGEARLCLSLKIYGSLRGVTIWHPELSAPHIIINSGRGVRQDADAGQGFKGEKKKTMELR